MRGIKKALIYIEPYAGNAVLKLAALEAVFDQNARMLAVVPVQGIVPVNAEPLGDNGL